MSANPYLDEFVAAHERADALSQFMTRQQLTASYAWAVPTPEAIEAIAKLSPIVEVGAGTGYWAWLLREAGAEVHAFDIAPPPTPNDYGHTRTWSEVQVGDARKAMAGGRRTHTLLLCWPPMSDMAYTALLAHRGEHVVYVGEGYGGCTANDEFHELLAARYEAIATPPIPRWWGLHDYCTIYRRRA